MRVITGQYLYADGSWQVVYIAINNDFYLDPGREFMQFISQFIAVSSVYLGLTSSFAVISTMLTFGYQFIPAIMLSAALVLKKENQIFSNLIRLLSIFVLVFASATMSESYFATSLFLLLLVLARSPELKSKIELQVALLILLVVSVRSYDSYSLYSIVILITLFTKNTSNAKSFLLMKTAWIVVAAISLLSASYFSIKRHSVFGVEQFQQFFGSQNMLLAGIILFIMTTGKVSKVANVILVFVLSVTIFVITTDFGLGMQFANRIMVSNFVFFMTLVFSFPFFYKRNLRMNWNPLALSLILVLGFSQSTTWKNFKDDFKYVVNSNSGLVSFENSGIDSTEFEKAGWSWTNPSLSLVLRQSEDSAIILPPSNYSGWQPWDPTQQVPPLDKRFKW